MWSLNRFGNAAFDHSSSGKRLASHSCKQIACYSLARTKYKSLSRAIYDLICYFCFSSKLEALKSNLLVNFIIWTFVLCNDFQTSKSSSEHLYVKLAEADCKYSFSNCKYSYFNNEYSYSNRKYSYSYQFETRYSIFNIQYSASTPEV